MYNLAICLTYFIEMLISYSFFSLIGDRKQKIPICLTIGTLLFLSGALFDIVLSNIVWLNTLYFLLINLLFGFVCYKIKFTRVLFYSIMLDIFNASLEFAAIFLISIVTNTEVTAYVDKLSFFVLDVVISKLLYFMTCLIMAKFIKKEKGDIKFPAVLYMYPVIVIATLLIFWSMCTRFELSYNYQLLLSGVSFALFASIVVLFISYQQSIEKENLIFALKNQVEKQDMDINYYNILEKQNEDLRIYAHDTKNHLNAIHNLNTNPEIDEYLNKMISNLKSYSSVCHSGNHMLDVIISKYATECEIKNISFSFDVCVTNLKYVKSNDLVTILSNALDNAIEAAEKSSSKTINIATDHINTYDVVTITNSCDTPPKIKGNDLETTKNNKINHGLGVKSIQKVLKQYNGDCQWEYNENKREFTLIISLLSQN